MTDLNLYYGLDFGTRSRRYKCRVCQKNISPDVPALSISVNRETARICEPCLQKLPEIVEVLKIKNL